MTHLPLTGIIAASLPSSLDLPQPNDIQKSLSKMLPSTYENEGVISGDTWRMNLQHDSLCLNEAADSHHSSIYLHKTVQKCYTKNFNLSIVFKTLMI